jgi:hypothetical protein
MHKIAAVNLAAIVPLLRSAGGPSQQERAHGDDPFRAAGNPARCQQGFHP